MSCASAVHLQSSSILIWIGSLQVTVWCVPRRTANRGKRVLLRLQITAILHNVSNSYVVHSDNQKSYIDWSPWRWLTLAETCIRVKVKWSRYRPGVARRVGRGIALLFHDRGSRRGWVVSSTPRPHFTPGKDTVPILQEAGWAPGPVWTGGKSRPHRDSIPDRLARGQSLYLLSYPVHHVQEYALYSLNTSEL